MSTPTPIEEPPVNQNEFTQIRNIAIIAHVDHGKTTLVDAMLRQTNVFRQNQKVDDRILDSNDLEKERGITILSKNTGIVYKNTTINIVDTPGHADFGGEVERALNMVDGVVLLIDAVEGPMPQTRFVLRQALQRKLKAIVVVNKVDRPASRPAIVVEETYDLFIDLGADDHQIDFPVVYTIALEGKSGLSPDELEDDLQPLFTQIIDHLPAPEVNPEGSPQMLVTTIEYSNFVGKIAVGRLNSGRMFSGQNILHAKADGESDLATIGQTYIFRNLKREEQEVVTAGNIVAVSGIESVGIGDTLTDPENPQPLPPIKVEEPTVRMTFGVNDSPFSGRSGKFLTSRQIRERLWRELESNVSLRVEETSIANEFVVAGRGELHLAILIETMRRELYEFTVSKPEVIYRQSTKGLEEPVEHVFIEVGNDYLGAVSELINQRQGRLVDLRYNEDNSVLAEYHVPTRGILGFRQPFLTITRGTGTFHSLFHQYAPKVGEILDREFGSLIALETGTVKAYALEHLQQRGTFFVSPGDEVYSGQVVGQNIRYEDLVINVCKTKNQTGHRSTPKATVKALAPARILSLDDAVEYLSFDEILEVTPIALRIRKKNLNHEQRIRTEKKRKSEQEGTAI